MSALWTSGAIADATGGLAAAAFVANGVAFDSREIAAGDLFVAMKGDATDGHKFLDAAFERGALGALVSEPTAYPHVRVADTFAALERLGTAARARTAARIFGVTGSVGKTSTKEALSDALARPPEARVHRSVKSYNNHTGVPLSLARMPATTEYGVFEMGMNHAGELAQLTRMVRPHVAIVTTVASVHLEFFANEEAIADAKAEIFEGLEPGGTAIIPFDNRHCARLCAAAKANGARIITFGAGEGADVRVMEAVKSKHGGTFVSAHLTGTELSFSIGQPGAHHVMNALAVLAAVEAAGADVALAGLALAEMGGLPGRGKRLAVDVPGGTAVLLDESYNANPTSMRATLAVLHEEDVARKIAVLGAMGELGPESPALHAGLAGPVRDAGVALAILVGTAMKPLADALEGGLKIIHVPDAATARDCLSAEIRAGDAVLIKGSNAIGLAQLVTHFAARTATVRKS